MPRDHRNSQRRVLRLVGFTLAGWALLVLARLSRRSADEPTTVTLRRRPRRRFATTFVTAMLFFAGASLTAVAGDRAAGLLDPTEEAELADAPETVVDATAAAPAAAAPTAAEGDAEAAPAAGGEAEAETDVDHATLGSELDPAAEPETAPAPSPEAAPAPEAAPGAESADAPAEAEPAPSTAATSSPSVLAPPPVEETSAPVFASASLRRPSREHDHDRDHAEPLDPEASEPGKAATVWLHRALPDPTPPSRRLAPGFARELVRVSRAHRVHWSLVLGTLRAERHGRSEGRMFAASRANVAQTATGLAALGARKRDRAWPAVLSLHGDTTVADRAVVLADYYRAVGLRALVRGLRAQEKRLVERVLEDERIAVYGGGRADLAEGRVDVRVVATMAFLAESFDQITVTSLMSGHRLYARPGVVSAHAYGAAVDVAALDGQIVSAFTQQPGGIVEQAVRKILLLPAEVRPRQLISLLGFGGPSFPLANHDDHVHIGF